MAGQVLLKISKDEVERARLMSEYKYALDIQSKLVSARREGKKEGKKEGLQEGLQQGKLEIALKMKRRGITAEQIAEDTGLSVTQIGEL